MFYVSVIDGKRYGLLLGPFRKREYAVEYVERVREAAVRSNSWAHFYAFGACKADTCEAGKLNDLFPDAPIAAPGETAVI